VPDTIEPNSDRVLPGNMSPKGPAMRAPPWGYISHMSPNDRVFRLILNFFGHKFIASECAPVLRASTVVELNLLRYTGYLMYRTSDFKKIPKP